MWRDIWAFVGDRTEVGLGLVLFAVVVLPLTVAAILFRPPQTPSFTLDWRQRAGFAWGGFFLLIAAMIIGGELAFAAGVLLYGAAWSLAPRLVGDTAWIEDDRRRRRWASLAVHGLVTLVCLPIVVFAVRENWLEWRFERDLRSNVALGIHMRAGWQGFPAPIENIKARVLEVERATPDMGWSPLPAQVKCWSLQAPSRSWLACADSNGQATSVALYGEPMARDFETARLADARRLLWVVTGKSSDAGAAALLSRKAQRVGDANLATALEGKFGYRLTADAPPRSP